MLNYTIDWQAVSDFWNNLNAVMQCVICGGAAYSSGWGVAKTAAQLWRLVRGPALLSRLRAWWHRPTRLDVVEGQLGALLVKLGEQPPKK